MWKQSELADALSPRVTATAHILLPYRVPQSPYKDHYHCWSKHIHASILGAKAAKHRMLDMGSGARHAHIHRTGVKTDDLIPSLSLEKRENKQKSCDSISIAQTPTAMVAEDTRPLPVHNHN